MTSNTATKSKTGASRHALGKPADEGASRLDGLLGSRDSGGSTWLNVAGGWAIVGVNSNGTGDTCRASSSFTWIAGVRGWLAATVHGTRFIA